MSQTCPSCEAPASGRFCNQCGVAIDAQCRECQNPLPAGARFCNQCGVTVAAQAAPRPPGSRCCLGRGGGGGGRAGGGVITPRLWGDAQPAASAAISQQAGAPVPAGGVDPSQVDLASMTPRERADRLFNRVMQGAAGRRHRAAGLLYRDGDPGVRQVPERNADLHYHLGELYRVTGDAASARAQADTILAADPEHLFGLYGAAQAEQTRGNADAAKAMYQRFLDAYAAQVARNLPEYREHRQGLPAMRAEAQQAVGQS